MAKHKNPTHSSDDSGEMLPQDASVKKSLEAFRETDILAFVEGELDQSQQEAMRAKLADHPELMLLIEAMQEDRRVLVSSQVPSMPAGMEADVQSALARPMLVAPQAPSPGTYRRQVNQQARRARLIRLASSIAAAIIVVVGAVLLATSIPFGSASRDVVNQSQPEAVTPSTARPLVTTPSRLATAPQAPVAPEVLVVSPTVADRESSDSWRLNDDPVPFALVLSASTERQASELLLGARKKLLREDGMITVVRNFSKREAAELEQVLLMGHSFSTAEPVADLGDSPGGSGVSAPWFEGADSNNNTNQPTNSVEPRTSRSGILAGPSQLAPDYNTQLIYSGKGAAYTVAIRLSDMDALLQELAILPPVSTRLETMTDEAPTDRLGQMAWIRQWISEVRSKSQSTIIYLPVIVELPKTTR